MKKVLRFTAAVILLLPAAYLLCLNSYHLWQLYVRPRGYSGGLHLRIGGMRIYDPWSDAISLATLAVVCFCGIAIARDSKKKIYAFIVGVAALVTLLFLIFS